MSYVCRLCLSSDVLYEILCELDGNINLAMKISSCINIEICPSEDLPLMICESCKNEINKFYDFKQECLRVDLNLRSRYEHFSNKNNITHKVNLEENKSLNLLNPIDKAPLPSELCIEEELLMKLDSNKNKFDSNTENKDLCVNKYQCEICGRVFKMKGGLDNHLIAHSGLKRFACKLCPKRFCRAENLAVHILSHSGIKPYICEICGKQLSRRQDLSRHKKVHSDNRDYACPKCNRYFKRSSDISSHMRTHTGMRPYQCKKCAKTYSSHSGLRKHKTHCQQ